MKRKLNEDDVPEAVGETVEKAAPQPKATFSNLGLDARLLQAVNREKFSTPTPIQTKAIPLALNGKNVLARAKTGSGKTLAYLLPILNYILRQTSSTKSSKTTTALILVPTKELATQVSTTIKTFTAFCGGTIRSANLTTKEDVAVIQAKLAEAPDVVVATPSRASLWVNNEGLKMDQLKWVVIDEADLVLSYGYEDDLKNLAEAIPSAGVQTMMMSATLSTSTTALSDLFCKSGEPTILDLSASEAAEKQQLSQYVIRTAEEDKFLLIYAIFKLQLIKGKVIVFVADIDRCYRVKLFLEQFGIRSCVLNSELPINSRLHVVEEFNKGVYDILIAVDEAEVVGDEGGARKKRKVEEQGDTENGDQGEDDHADEDEAVGVLVENGDAEDEDGIVEKGKHQKPKETHARRKQSNSEFGISRGIDFRHVSCVLNFDLPTTSKSYTHRTGRTARAGQTGMALSFYVPKELYRKHKSTSIPQCENDEQVLAKIKKREEGKGRKVDEWQFDMQKLEGLRYRFGDALRNVTRIAIREARTRELKRELINSAKLQRHFEENPEELRHLRHDGEGATGHTIRSMPHLKHVPDYLLPSGGKRAVQGEVGFVSIRGDKEKRDRTRRQFGKGAAKGRMQSRKWKGKGVDPLKSLNVKGRMKK